MATRIVAPTLGVPPSATDATDLDSVVLWLTPTIERDYIERGVFRAYRAETAAGSRANATLHFLTHDEAQALLDDAEVRRLETHKSLKAAFNAHAANLRMAIDEASTRRASLEATEPVCKYSSEMFERWRGSKEQLRSLGIWCDTPYPGEAGGKRWMQARDRRGYKVRITRASTIWAGLFDADIELPAEVREAKREKQRAVKEERARLQELKTMPATPDKFRSAVADSFWSWVCGVVKPQMESKDGYRFAPDVVDEFIETVTEAYWALREGETIGCSPRKRLQQVLCANAKADAPLQRFLSGLRPNDAH